MRLLIAITLSILFLSATKRPVWSDEFNYSGMPDTSKWIYDLGNNNGWGNNELQCYTNLPKNVRVENGHLIVEAHRDSLEGNAFTSGRILSKNKGDWRYGKIVLRAKLPKGKGTWAALWMLPSETGYGGWPSGGEIDIMEHVGYDPGIIHGTIHTEAYNHIKQTQKEAKILIRDAQEAFHTYAIDWQKNKIDFLIDDKLYYTFKRTPHDGYKEWPFDKKFHLLINLAVGGNWGGKEGVDNSIWPQRIEVDYVRVYQ